MDPFFNMVVNIFCVFLLNIFNNDFDSCFHCDREKYMNVN